MKLRRKSLCLVAGTIMALRVAQAQPVSAVRDFPGIATLSRVSGLALFQSGDVAVADLLNGSVHLITTRGAITTYGRNGAGPGDLSYPCCLTPLDDSTLLVRELGNRRYSLLKLRRGKLEFLRSLQAPSGGVFDGNGAPVANGRVLHLAPAPTDMSKDRKFDLTLLDLAGSAPLVPGRRLESGPLPWQAEAEVVKKVPGGQVRNVMALPFGPRYLYALRSDGAWLSAHSAVPRVEWKDSGGKLARVLSISETRAPIGLTKAERDSSETLLSEWARSQAVRREDIPLRIPLRKPALEALGVDQDGRVWVQLPVPSGHPNRAIVFSIDGRQLDSVAWPAGIQFVTGWAITGQRGVGVRFDADGIPTLVSVEFESPALKRQ